MKFIIDAAAGIGLFFALMLVFLVDGLITYFSNRQSPNTLENVSEERPKSRTHGKKLRLGVTETGRLKNKEGKDELYDDMGKLLKELGKGYSFDDLKIEDLTSNPKKIYDYDVVFLTCNAGHEDALKDVLFNYVSEGGILYASDFRFDAIAKAFPTEIDKGLVGQGHAQELDADIVDAGLYDYLNADKEIAKELKGKKLHLKFDLGEWRPAAFNSPRIKVLLKGHYKRLHLQNRPAPEPPFVTAPLMVKFQVDKGTVIFTSFHNEKQNSAVEKKLLEYLVFSLVTAGVDADISSDFNKGGFAPQRSNLLSTPKGNPEIKKEYENKQPADLRFALGFRGGEGAKMRFNIKSPDGKQYTWEGDSTIILNASNAKAGTWTYTVTALNLPYENFPFTVTVGEKK